jgi:hypothetical protein
LTAGILETPELIPSGAARAESAWMAPTPLQLIARWPATGPSAASGMDAAAGHVAGVRRRTLILFFRLSALARNFGDVSAWD